MLWIVYDTLVRLCLYVGVGVYETHMFLPKHDVTKVSSIVFQ